MVLLLVIFLVDTNGVNPKDELLMILVGLLTLYLSKGGLEVFGDEQLMAI